MTTTKTTTKKTTTTVAKTVAKKPEAVATPAPPTTPAVVAQPPATTEEVLVEEEDSASSSDKYKRQNPTRDSIMASFEEIIKSIETEIESIREGDAKTKGIKFLRSLNKRLKILRNQSARIIKQKKTGARKATTSNNSGFLKPVKISKEMASFTGWSQADLKSRVAVTKYICNYIKENNLQNPQDKRQINVDAKLSKLLKYDAKKESEPLTYYALQKHLKSHFIKPEVASA